MVRYLVDNPKRSIATLATALAAVGVAVGSGAGFTSQTVNAANTFQSGTLLQSNSKVVDGVASTSIVTGSNLKPGDQRQGTVKIKNTGTLAGTFTLKEINDSNAFAAGKLTLKVEDITGSSPVELYSGDLGSAPDKALGSFAAGEEREYRFTVKLQESATNADQNKSATADYEWSAVPTS